MTPAAPVYIQPHRPRTNCPRANPDTACSSLARPRRDTGTQLGEGRLKRRLEIVINVDSFPNLISDLLRDLRSVGE